MPVMTIFDIAGNLKVHNDYNFNKSMPNKFSIIPTKTMLRI